MGASSWRRAFILLWTAKSHTWDESGPGAELTAELNNVGPGVVRSKLAGRRQIRGVRLRPGVTEEEIVPSDVGIA